MGMGLLLAAALSLTTGQTAPQSPAPGTSNDTTVLPVANDDVAQLKAQAEAQAQALQEAQARIEALESTQSAQSMTAEQREALAAAQAARAQQLQQGTDTLSSQVQAQVDRQDLDEDTVRKLSDKLGATAQNADDNGSPAEAQSTDNARAWMQHALESSQTKNGNDVMYQLDRAVQNLKAAQNASP